jgi:hypothetical protein
MSKPWREEGFDTLSTAYAVSPGPAWGTILIDGEVETVDELSYRKEGRSCISIRDGSFRITFRPVKYNWVGEEVPEELRGKWAIDSVLRM